MTQWFTGFVIPDVAEVHKAFGRVIETAVRLDAVARGTPLAGGAAATLAELRQAYVDFNAGLRAAAEEGAVNARRGILDRLHSTQVRSDTGTSPHLRTLIRCAPLSVGAVETGVVGVGDVSELDRAINPRGHYGPYWRPQEFGTGGGEVPSQVGRIIFGYFDLAGGGDPTPPQAQYAGGGGPHPIFLSSSNQGQLALFGGGKRGGRGGIGTIGHEIHARHFLSLGKDGAAVRWRDQINALQQRAVDRLASIGVP